MKLEDLGFLRLPEVLKLFPVKRDTWYRGIASGKYPKQIKLSEKISVWRVKDIKELLESYGEDSGKAA